MVLEKTLRLTCFLPDPWLIYKIDRFLIVSKSVAIFILSHSSGNSSKISHIPPGILRKSLTFLGEFFENLSHSSGNSSKIPHIPGGILQKSFVESLKAVSSLLQSMGFSNLSILVLFFYWKEIVIYFRKLIKSVSFVYIFTLYSSCQLFLWRLI